MNDQTFFDTFAEQASRFVSRAPFFSFCVFSIIIWLPSFPFFRNAEEWQLPINTLTTVVTFILVALLQNSTQRFEDATNEKLNGMLELLAELTDDPELRAKCRRLCGIEEEIGA